MIQHPLFADPDRPILLRPGETCWAAASATRAAVLTNADYFRALAEALSAAQRQVIVLGWLLDPMLVLDPARGEPLVALLARLLAERPGLMVRLLLWRRSVFYGGLGRAPRLLGRLRQRSRRFDVRYVRAPLAASLHQKLIAIDGVRAFVGGIDLAGDRWDARGHPPILARRITPDGERYGPTHDLAMLVEGPVAGDLAILARARWARVTGEQLPVPDPVLPAPLVRAATLAELPGARIGIARTDPGNPRGPVREVEALNRAALAAARRVIYLEAQYLTSSLVGDLLAERLREPDGPEVVVVVTRTSAGRVEQFTMGNNRDRLLRRLQAADRWRRLRVYYPVVGRRQEVRIHAKLVVVDDRFLRIGSSNLNNRSMGVDGECDLGIEAHDTATRRRILALRHRLVADQLHRSAGDVADAVRRSGGSLIAAIEQLNPAAHLMPLQPGPGPDTPLPGTGLFDPPAPLTLGYLKSYFADALTGRCRPAQPVSSRTANRATPKASGTR